MAVVVTWRFDHSEVRRVAREELGIKHPVVLRRRSRQRRGRKAMWCAWHVWQHDRTHYIYIIVNDGWWYAEIDGKPAKALVTTDPEDAKASLAHELCHAKQSERYGSPDAWSRAYYRIAAAFGDANHGPIEAEAERAEMKLLPLLANTIKEVGNGTP